MFSPINKTNSSTSYKIMAIILILIQDVVQMNEICFKHKMEALLKD